MQNSKLFPGNNTPDPRFWSEESFFVLRKSKLLYCNSNDEFKIFTRDKTSDLLFMEEESFYFLSPTMYKNSLTAMPNSKISPGTLIRTPVLGERRVCFCYLKIYQNSPTAIQNSKNLPGTIPRTFVLGEKSLFPFSENVPT